MSTQYDKAAKIIGETPEILSARADLATWENNYAKAESLVNKARAQKPKDAMILRMSGMVLFYKNRYAKMQEDGYISGTQSSSSPRLNVEELDQARIFLKRAMLKNSDDIAAHYYYAQSYSLMYELPSKQAIASAETAIDYYRSVNFVDSNLNMARVLLLGQKYSEALPVANKALVWSRQSGMRFNARNMKRTIENQD